MAQWQTWSAAHPQIRDSGYIRALLSHAQRHGVQSRFLGAIPPEAIEVRDANYRESFLARGFNPRLRIVLDLLLEVPAAADPWNARIYAPEALTHFARTLAGHYPRFLGSEYASTDEQRQWLFPIRAEDLLNLSFPDRVFDIVLSNEIFEHIPDLSKGITEIARVLKPGGTLLATFPFAYDSAQTIVKAWFEGGQLCYNGPAEYHGNPVDPA
ncbi:MAG: class I SAM-dependent methyltransferase, partial [Chloroflexi bacterium]|nr:class I SAM-dependent methyltransferase [Chloroflexota bacterium]